MRQTMRLTKVELRRLLMNKKTYILMIANILIIALGYVEFVRNIGDYIFTASRLCTIDNIVFPFAIGTLGGSLIWGISLIVDSDRVKKNYVKDMINAFTDERKASLSRIFAYSVIILVTLLIGLLVVMPICSKRMDYLFDFRAYLTYPVLVFIPGCFMTLFLCEGLYKMSENKAVSLTIFLVLTAAQFSPLFIANDFFRWNMPIVSDISDAFGSPTILRILGYTRILLLAVSICIWEFACLFIRKYQYGALRSFSLRIRKPAALIVPVLFAVIVIIGAVKQPFIDHAPIVSLEDGGDLSFSEEETEAEYASYKRNLSFSTALGTMRGEDECVLAEVMKDEITFTLGAGIKLKSATLDGEPLDFSGEYDVNNNFDTYFGNKLYKIKNPEKKTGKLKLVYGGYPAVSRSTMACLGYMNENVIGKSFIGISWLCMGPVYSNVFGPDKELYINVPSNQIPLIEAEEMEKVKDNGDGTTCWKAEYSSGNLMSGAYNSDKVSYSAEDVYFKYSSKYGKAVQENDLDGAICNVFDYCDKHFGPIEKNSSTGEEIKDIKILQTSAEYGGGYADDGAVVMSEHFMSPQTLSDSRAGTNMNETFMHEIIHLYWGDLGMVCQDDGLWSAEGLTVFTTYRIVKEKYGELYAKQYYVDEWKKGVMHLNNNFYFRHPEYLDKLPDTYRAQIESGVESTRKYELMPLMLLKAEEKLGGEEEMDKVLQELYSRNLEFRLNETGCTYQDFLDTAGLTEEDLKLE